MVKYFRPVGDTWLRKTARASSCDCSRFGPKRFNKLAILYKLPINIVIKIAIFIGKSVQYLILHFCRYKQ